MRKREREFTQFEVGNKWFPTESHDCFDTVSPEIFWCFTLNYEARVYSPSDQLAFSNTCISRIVFMILFHWGGIHAQFAIS